MAAWLMHARYLGMSSWSIAMQILQLRIGQSVAVCSQEYLFKQAACQQMIRLDVS